MTPVSTSLVFFNISPLNWNDVNNGQTFFKFLSFFSFSAGRVVLVTAAAGGGEGRGGLAA